MDSERLDGSPGDCVVRTLNKADLDRLVRMDEEWVGRNRRRWFEGKLERAFSGSDVTISLGAEVDGTLVGALMGAVHYGEFGQPEPVAILDTILVDRGQAGHGIGHAMMDQLVKNLRALRIERLRTEVAWTEQSLVGFLAAEGFAPSPRLVLERALDA